MLALLVWLVLLNRHCDRVLRVASINHSLWLVCVLEWWQRETGCVCCVCTAHRARTQEGGYYCFCCQTHSSPTNHPPVVRKGVSRITGVCRSVHTSVQSCLLRVLLLFLLFVDGAVEYCWKVRERVLDCAVVYGVSTKRHKQNVLWGERPTYTQRKQGQQTDCQSRFQFASSSVAACCPLPQDSPMACMSLHITHISSTPQHHFLPPTQHSTDHLTAFCSSSSNPVLLRMQRPSRLVHGDL